MAVNCQVARWSIGCQGQRSVRSTGRHGASFAGGLATGIGTPLQETFDHADVALADESSLPGDRTVVLLVSDGQGNCFTDPALTGIPTDIEINRPHDWSNRGIRTYVIDLATTATAILDDFAFYGGTTPIRPTDPVDLEAKLEAFLDDSTCP